MQLYGRRRNEYVGYLSVSEAISHLYLSFALYVHSLVIFLSSAMWKHIFLFRLILFFFLLLSCPDVFSGCFWAPVV